MAYKFNSTLITMYHILNNTLIKLLYQFKLSQLAFNNLKIYTLFKLKTIHATI